METKIKGLPDWTVSVKEVSASVYKLRALHTLGPTIELTGEDPQALMRQAEKDAAEIGQALKLKTNG